MKLESGTTISHYKILSEIGKGGMGEVYLAEDTKLDRKVAVKFLSEKLSDDSDKVNRFVQEAKAASALNHPNILTVHEIGTWQDTRYIATEYIEGRTLRDLIGRREPVHLNRVLKIGIQVAEALSAAHRAGIAHRDIKPENIMVREDGYVKVLDFGLAKLVEKQKKEGDISLEGETKALVKTTPGLVMGTVSYMSPEQARGNDTDERTDIWSLGVVLYEMLAGKVPFEGETVNHTIVAILETEPKLLEKIPGELQRIIRKTLTKEKDNRYQTARDLVIDLKNLRRELDLQGELERSVIPNRDTEAAIENETTHPFADESTDKTASGQAPVTQNVTTSSSSLEYAVTQAKSHKALFAFLGLILIGVISAVAYFAFFAGTASNQIDSIAVMPFVNESGDGEVEFLSDGMTETLINSLSQIESLNVKARSSVFRYKGKNTNAKTIGNELGVEAILNGRLVRRGEKLILSLELINAQTENVLWGRKYERTASEIVSLQTEIAKDVSTRLKSDLTGEDAEKVTKAYTSNPEAYQAYLKGRFYWNKRIGANLKIAIEQFKIAVEKDPNYALAYVGLGDCYALLNEYTGASLAESSQQAKVYAERAIAIDPLLGEPHATLGQVYEQLWQWKESEQEYKRAIKLSPKYATAYQWYYILLVSMDRVEEGSEMIDRAREIDPLSMVIGTNQSVLYQIQGDHDKSIENSRKLIELDPSFPFAYQYLALSLLKTGNNDEAIKNLEKAVEISGRDRNSLSDLGYGYGVTGQREKALAIARELEDKYARKEAHGYYVAPVYLGLGDKDKAFEWLEKDFRAKTSLPRVKREIIFDSIRDDPRYKDLMKRMGLPE